MNSKALQPYLDILSGIKRAYEKGQLAHGYIFFGEDSLGRRAAAEALAHFFECGSFGCDNHHRILTERLMIVPDKSGSIGINVIRDMQAFLWQTPQKSARRLAIVDAAEELTEQAEHALLKITEEPPPHGFIIIQVRDPARLLPTIRSRLGMIHFGKGKLFADVPQEALEYARKFLLETCSGRTRMARELLDDKSNFLYEDKDRRVKMFLAALMIELRRDLHKNAPLLALILQRMVLLSQYNVNKRLELEVINYAL